jgi:outer membrane protein
MKKIFLIGFLTLLAGQFSQAQTKMGYFDIDYVLPLLPETKKVESDMKVYVDQVKKEMDAKSAEYTKKVDEFKAKSPTWPASIQKSRAEEIQSLEKQIGDFEQQAQGDIQNRQAQLMSPIYEKIEKTIKEVAQGNGFTHIFRSEFCYAANKTNNISDLVLKKLGVTPPPPKTN